jgi:hypothetical protein
MKMTIRNILQIQQRGKAGKDNLFNKEKREITTPGGFLWASAISTVKVYDVDQRRGHTVPELMTHNMNLEVSSLQHCLSLELHVTLPFPVIGSSSFVLGTRYTMTMRQKAQELGVSFQLISTLKSMEAMTLSSQRCLSSPVVT